ncbi:pilus assembly FimT family protein [Stenotrophomonas sp. NPDC077659]|uniref:pilus assembly FimT family protein n=1 Tax=Stenotrophomonas sp. NPDC077659 TaxID=3390694 RepID=UPI003D079E44
MPRLRQQGVTLIELMITLSIVAFLLMAAAPFGAHWVQSNRQMQARSLLWEGVSQARAIALRNPQARAMGTPAATLQMRAGQLEVVVPGVDAPLWTAPLRAGVSLKLTDHDGYADAAAMQATGHPGFDCLNFDMRGLRLPGASGCTDSAQSLNRIAIGLANQDPLYVDLL